MVAEATGCAHRVVWNLWSYLPNFVAALYSILTRRFEAIRVLGICRILSHTPVAGSVWYRSNLYLLPNYHVWNETGGFPFPESDLARSSIDCELDVAYGPAENEKLDIFGAKSLPNGTWIHICYKLEVYYIFIIGHVAWLSLFGLSLCYLSSL